MSTKIKERENVEVMTASEFHTSYKQIAEAKVVVGIKRFGNVDGYFVPAETYEALIKAKGEQ